MTRNSRSDARNVLESILVEVEGALSESGAGRITLSLTRRQAEYLRSSLGRFMDGTRLDKAFGLAPQVGRPRSKNFHFERMIQVHRLRTENPKLTWKAVAAAIGWPGEPEVLKATYHKHKESVAAAWQVLCWMTAERNKTRR